MSLIGLFVVLIVFGFLLWLVTQVIPLDPTVRKIIIGVACLLLVLWLVDTLGLLDSVSSYRIGRHR
jgi:hypothetical protein